MSICIVDGCERPIKFPRIGLCQRHYHKKRYYGTLTPPEKLHKSTMREWRIWHKMKYRCFNPNSNSYRNYGGRGITICERWMKFEDFYADMGPCPTPKHTIDRIDSNGNYEPGNCRWATMREQAQNRRH